MIIAVNFSNLNNWKEEAWENQGFNEIRTRDLRDAGAMLYQLSYEATHWERGQIIEVISPVKSGMMWSIYACSCRSLAVQIYELFHIYFTSFHSSPEIWTQLFGLAPNVWLRSSVGGASHRHRGGHGFESRWSLDFLRLLLSNCLNWKNLLRWSFLTSIYICSSNIWIISYILHIKTDLRYI